MASVTASYPQIIALAAAVVGIGGGVVWVYSHAASLYHRTFGGRRDLAKRLNQVAAGVTTRYIEERFGAPAFARAFRPYVKGRGIGPGWPALFEQLYYTRHAWLQVLTDEHDAVVRFSVTVTDPRFHFQIRDLTVNQLDVKLGHTRFSGVKPAPGGRSLWIGARRHGYSEYFYFGNPGNYQHYVLSKNDAGVNRFGFSALPDDISRAYQDGSLNIVEDEHGPPPPGLPPYDPAAPYAMEFRSQTVINTLTVLGANNDPEALAEPHGPDADYVRVLISGPWELRQRRRRARPLRRLLREIGRASAPLPEEAAPSADETTPPAT